MTENISNTNRILWDFLYQHKRLMSARVDSFSKLIKLDDIQSYFYKLTKEALVIKNLYFKFLLSPNSKIENQINNNTISLLKTEKDLLVDFIGRLKTIN